MGEVWSLPDRPPEDPWDVVLSVLRHLADMVDELVVRVEAVEAAQTSLEARVADVPDRTLR